MLERVSPPLSDTEMAAMRSLIAERGFEIRNRPLLLELETRGFVRQSIEGWSVTIPGHLAYLKTLTANF